MSPLVFLVGLLVLSLIGGLVLWLRDRTPQSMEAHMKAFERELEALSPETPISPEVRRRRPPARPVARPSHQPRSRPTPRGPRTG